MRIFHTDNIVMQRGRLGSDPTIRTTKNDRGEVTFANFSIRVEQRTVDEEATKANGGVPVYVTYNGYWQRCEAKGKLATEVVAKLKSGQRVFVMGENRGVDDYIDPETKVTYKNQTVCRVNALYLDPTDLSDWTTKERRGKAEPESEAVA